VTSVERYEPPAQLTPFDPTGGRLVAWAQAAGAAHDLASALVQTNFVPQVFRGKVGDGTAAIIMGDELGLSPLAALRSIYMISGTPAMYARTMVALAQSRGHEIWTEKSTAAEVIVCGRRRGSEHVERAVWTIARAQKAGYTKNAKYQSSPDEMLYAKAAAEVARKVAADVLLGVPFSVEDLELEQPAATVTVTRQNGATKTVQRAQPATAQPEPDLEPEPAKPEPPAVEPKPAATDGEPMITRAQSSKLHAVFGDFGISERAHRLRVVSKIIGRDVASSSDVTKAEATTLIDTLESIQRGNGDSRANLDWYMDQADAEDAETADDGGFEPSLEDD
jgi:hypothetical protein